MGHTPSANLSPIPPPSDFNPPDLSEPLTESQYQDLKAVIKAGKASEYYNVGDTIKVSYGNHIMPFEIMDFESTTRQKNGNEEVVPAINVWARYTDDVGELYDNDIEASYSGSALRTFITGPYQNKLDPNFVACLADSKVETVKQDGSIDVVYDKLYAPSFSQVNVKGSNYVTPEQIAIEGASFNKEDGGQQWRIRQGIDSQSTGKTYWLRSSKLADVAYAGRVLYNGNSGIADKTVSYFVAPAGNLIGD